MALSAAMMFSGAAVPMSANIASAASQARQMEELNRGLVATVVTQSTQNNINKGGVYLSWRVLGKEDLATTAYDIYRKGTSAKIATVNGGEATNYIDGSGNINSEYQVVMSGQQPIEGEWVKPQGTFRTARGSYVGNGTSEPNAFTYVDIPIQIPADTARMGDGKMSTYRRVRSNGANIGGANDASVGDLDGDGDYEIVLKWDPQDSKDSAGADFTGNVYIDAYEIDPNNTGYKWRIDLGPNVTAGAHYTQFIVYDFDGDGKSEIAMKTAPGSKDGQGNYVSLVGDSDEIRNVDNTQQFIGTSGRLKGKNPFTQYLTIFEGETGAALYTTDYIPYNTFSQWGDKRHSGEETYNRSERYLAGVAYLDGVHPSLIMCRGYYDESCLRAYDWDGQKLTMRWEHKAGTNSADVMFGQGNHNLSIADVDNDGKDEIVYGSATLDDDGKTMVDNTRMGHGDAMHVNDFNNDGYQEVFSVKEDTSSSMTTGANLRQPKKRGDSSLFKLSVTKGSDGKWPDVGRGVMDNIDDAYASTHPNALALAWDSYHTGVYGLDGTQINETPPGTTSSGKFSARMNFLVYWDSDLGREVFDDNIILKYYADTGISRRFYDDGSGYSVSGSSNNHSKATPSLVADLWGDWREEIIMPVNDGADSAAQAALRIFTSVQPTKYRLTTLMHDCQYREAIAWQNVAYNQPPHTSYYIGSAALASGKNYLAPKTPFTKVYYPEKIAVENVSVTPKTLSIGVGMSKQLTAQITPQDATTKNVSWSSSDEGIAEVDPSGNVTGVKEGTVLITATVKDNGNVFTDSCTVSVYPVETKESDSDVSFETQGTAPSGTEITNTADGSKITQVNANNGVDVSKSFTPASSGKATLTFRLTTGGQRIGPEENVPSATADPDGKIPTQSTWNWTGHEYTFGVKLLDSEGNNILHLFQAYTSSAQNLKSQIKNESTKDFGSDWTKVIDGLGNIQGSTKRWMVTAEFDYDADTCTVTVVGTDGNWKAENGKYTKAISLGGKSFKTLQYYTQKDSGNTGGITVSPVLEKVKYELTAANEGAAIPTLVPVSTPTPTASPSQTPTAAPKSTPTPTAMPTQKPTPMPTATPTQKPTATPTPTASPSPIPTAAPTSTPTPTATPTQKPTAAPTASPTKAPQTNTPAPTVAPPIDTAAPTDTPPVNTPTPTVVPSADTPAPTVAPPVDTTAPTDTPQTDTPAPTDTPQTDTPAPTDAPPIDTTAPTDTPQTDTPAPTNTPQTDTPAPTVAPPVDTPIPTDAPPVNTPSPDDRFIITGVSGNAVDVEIHNSEGMGKTILIGALYDGGRLVECKFETIEANGADPVTKSLIFENNAESYEVKAFLWNALDGVNGIKPIFDSAVYKSDEKEETN